MNKLGNILLLTLKILALPLVLIASSLIGMVMFTYLYIKVVFKIEPELEPLNLDGYEPDLEDEI